MTPAGRVAAALAVCLLGLCACGHANDEQEQVVPPADPRSGGAATVFDSTAASFSRSAAGLDGSERSRFAVGNAFFNDNWVIAPASTEGRDGLGPMFNAVSCSGCHLHDGRAAPTTATNGSPGLLIRLSRRGSDPDDPVYGGQLSDQANPGVPAEGTVTITTTAIHGTFRDGTRYTLAEPHYAIDWKLGRPAPGLVLSPRVAPALVGPGLLEAIPAADIHAAADPHDRDHDGISGRTSTVVDAETGKSALGRFGWKAGQPTVRAQAAAAFQADIGITSSLHPDQSCTDAEKTCRSEPNGGDPELDGKKLDRVTFYNRTLAVPARRGVHRRAVTRGAELFHDAGCGSCHTPTQRTGSADVEVLDHQLIHPYTDLLLHDMGPALADTPRGVVSDGSEWRTAPLWGIGLVRTVSGHTRYLHDGRARNLQEAILWHGGEATDAQEHFRGLSADDRASLITFLGSL